MGFAASASVACDAFRSTIRDLTVENCHFSSLSTNSSGGAIFLSPSGRDFFVLVVQNSVFRNCSAVQSGGGIECLGRCVKVTHCRSEGCRSFDSCSFAFVRAVGEEAKQDETWITFSQVAVVGCACQNGTVHLEANNPNRTSGHHGRLVAASCNFTQNRVIDSGAAVYLDQSAALIFQFSRLESNSDRNTLTLGMCDVSAPTLSCLAMVNNTVRGVGGGNIPGLILSPD
jgi:hypothetical protein